MKRLFTCILIIATLLSLAACGDKAPEAPATETKGSTGNVGIPTLPGMPAEDALSRLRADMKPPVIAVANFHFPELSEEFSIMEYLMDEYPSWMEENDFIRNIPEERIILTCGYEDWGNLVCVVPYDQASKVSVKATQWAEDDGDREEEVVYSSESGDPILLLADTSDYVIVSVEVIDSQGRGVVWYPYWENANPIPEDAYSGHLVMDFTPASEKTAYQNALDYGWTVPDESFLDHHLWESDYGYMLDLYYFGGEEYDGEAFLLKQDETGDYPISHYGTWCYVNGLLHLELSNYLTNDLEVKADFPILLDPYGENWLGIYRSETGAALPYFDEYMEYDELKPVYDDRRSPYDNALSQGGYVPELWELVDSFWLSDCDYALELMDDSVPNDNGGWANLYEVGEAGEYIEYASGSWRLEEGQLYLSLVPAVSHGQLVDDSFPVLMLEGRLWIGRNSFGMSLPHFYSDMQFDILQQPMG